MNVTSHNTLVKLSLFYEMLGFPNKWFWIYANYDQTRRPNLSMMMLNIYLNEHNFWFLLQFVRCQKLHLPD
mgnify:CR=1 FL=1